MGDFTENNLFYKPALAETNWHTPTNENWDAADTLIKDLQDDIAGLGGGSGLDVGTIVRSKVAPATGTWLKCNGSAHVKATYPSLFTAIGQLHPLTTWQRRAPRSSSSIVHDGTYFWAASSGGLLEKSTDLETWMNVTTGLTISGAGTTIVAYLNGAYIVGAQSVDTTSTSTDGTTWSAANSLNVTFVTSFAYGNGVYVAVGSNGTLSSSTDRLTWTSRTSNIGANIITGIIYANSLFVAVGNGGKISTSPDGITWTAQTSGFSTTNISGITYGAGTFVAVGASGKISTSTNGTTWSAQTPVGTVGFQSVTYFNSLFVAGANSGGTGVYTSPDGVTWTARTSGSGAIIQRPVIVSGILYFPCTNTFIYSSDAITWKTKTLPSTTFVKKFGSNYLANSTFPGFLWTSTDGIEWTGQNSGFGTTNNVNVVSYNGTDLYVAAGAAGTLSTSPDLVTWTLRTSNFGSNAILSIAYGNGMFVIAGSASSVASSPDGITWTPRNAAVGNISLTSVTYADGKFVLVGNGRVSTSTDGITWTPAGLSTFLGTFAVGSMNAVTYGNGTFVAVGGGIMISTDGVSWVNVPAPFGTTTTFNSIAFFNGVFYAMHAGSLMISTNGIDWVIRETPGLGICIGELPSSKLLMVTTAIHVIGTEYAYDTSTHFRVPLIPLFDGADSWIKAS